MMRRRDLAFLVLALSVAAACLRLGFWQLDRLGERRARNALIRQRLALPPLELSEVEWVEADLGYRNAEGAGRWDPAYELVLINRARGGVPGAHLVTPLQIEGGSVSILVDRGWVPQAAADEEAREVYGAQDWVRVSGVLKPAQQEPSWAFLADPTPVPGGPPRTGWRVLHIPWIQRQIPYPLAPYYLELTVPPSEGPQPETELEIDLSEGPHLGYAIQWFLFSGIALGGGAVWWWKRARPAG